MSAGSLLQTIFINTKNSTVMQHKTLYITTIILFLFCLPPLVLASDTANGGAVGYEGMVTDEVGHPMPYVSIYLRNSPQIGTISNDSGAFYLAIDKAKHMTDVLVFSFIGYATHEVEVATLDTLAPIDIMLVEQPVMLEGAEVRARISKKQSKKMKRDALERFVAQLEADFPPRTTEYRVVSSYQGAQEDLQLIRNEILGTITEYPYVRENGSDSVVVNVESEKVYTSDQIEMGYEMFNDMAEEKQEKNARKKKRKNKNQVQVKYKVRGLDEQMVKMHQFLWGGYTANIIDMLNVNKLSLWDYNVIGNSSVLTYTYKRNYLGIAKGTLQIHFYVDPNTYQVEKIAQSLDGELHIPFGYKLKQDELDFINVLQMGRDTLESYRAKHVYVDVQRNVFFRRVDGNVVVREKNLSVEGSVMDRRDKTLNYNAQAKVIVSGRPKITR